MLILPNRYQITAWFNAPTDTVISEPGEKTKGHKHTQICLQLVCTEKTQFLDNFHSSILLAEMSVLMFLLILKQSASVPKWGWVKWPITRECS